MYVCECEYVYVFVSCEFQREVKNNNEEKNERVELP